MCMLLKVKRSFPMRSMKKVFTKNSVFQMDQGNLKSRLAVIEARKLSEDIRVKHAHDGTGQPVEPSSSSTHIVKEQFVPEEHRDIASFNADNELNRAINEEDIDFNIPGVPHSTVKQLHGAQRSRLDSKNREPPESARSPTRPTTKSIIQSLQPRIKKNDS